MMNDTIQTGQQRIWVWHYNNECFDLVFKVLDSKTINNEKYWNLLYKGEEIQHATEKDLLTFTFIFENGKLILHE
jgi:hypothetical protein